MCIILNKKQWILPMQHCYWDLAIAELSQEPSSTFSRNHYTLKYFTSFQLKISNTDKRQNQNKWGSLPETIQLPFHNIRMHGSRAPYQSVQKKQTSFLATNNGGLTTVYKMWKSFFIKSKDPGWYASNILGDIDWIQ